VLTDPALLTVSLSSTDPLCNGAATGTVTSTVAGGTAAYTYLWSDGSTTADLNNVLAGTYTVTVTDAHGCTATPANAAVLTDPALLTISLTPVDPGCNNDSTGSLTSTVAGGTGGYTYVWSTGATSADIIHLPAGTYDVTVTDAHGCTASPGATVYTTLPCCMWMPKLLTQPALAHQMAPSPLP
jgi:hypothetical protein